MNIVDMHCDTISKLLEERQAGKPEGLRRNSCHIDLEKLAHSGYLVQNFAQFVQLSQQEDPWKQVQALISLYQEEINRNSDRIAPAYCYQDIMENKRQGKISALLTVEEGGVCQGELAKLVRLYEQGVRMMTLVWNYPNELGCPNLERSRGKAAREKAEGLTGEEKDRMIKRFLNTPDTMRGLTETGFAFVEKMQELGMIVDVSHMSDAGFYDVLRTVKVPFVASHSNARAVCPCVRNLSDDMIIRLAEHGGVMGLNFCADFLTQLPAGVHNPGTIEAIVRHARHIADIGGMECIGLGSDFDGIDTHEELPGADKMERLFDALFKGGFTEREIDKIFWGNVLRVYREVLR